MVETDQQTDIRKAIVDAVHEIANARWKQQGYLTTIPRETVKEVLESEWLFWDRANRESNREAETGGKE